MIHYLLQTEDSTGEGGLRGILAELMQACASTTNFRPAAVLFYIFITMLCYV